MKDPYIYEGTEVLKNKFGITNFLRLKAAESDISFAKLLDVRTQISGKQIGIQDLQRVHKYILGDLFEWAGEFRTVPIVKPEKILGGDTVRYAQPNEIKKQAEEKIQEMNETKWDELDIVDKSKTFAKQMAGLWQVHPFRDGNTRTILVVTSAFAEENNFPLKLNILLDNFAYFRNALVKASDGEYADYQYLNRIVLDSIQTRQIEQTQEQER